MTVKTTDVQKAYNEYLNEKNRQATYSQNNKNEKEFYRHLTYSTGLFFYYLYF